MYFDGDFHEILMGFNVTVVGFFVISHGLKHKQI